MGYANPAQLTAGIHTRQYSRAFVIDDHDKRVVFVSVDCAMLDQIVKTEVGNGIIASFSPIVELKKGKFYFPWLLSLDQAIKMVAPMSFSYY